MAASYCESPDVDRLAAAPDGTGEARAMVYVGFASEQNIGMRVTPVATEYDGVRSDVKDSRDYSLQAPQSAGAPDSRNVVPELDGTDALGETSRCFV